MQNKKSKLWSIAFLALTLFFCSCQKQELPNEDNPNLQNSSLGGRTVDNIPFREGANTILGDSKQNPYTVKNMTAAWQDLLNRGIKTNAETNVYTSHYYVKFKPKNSDEYEILHEDSTLALSDLPIESTVTLNGDYYHDPSLPDSVPTYQYTAVKVDYQFPKGIDYQILDNLYIPEQDAAFNYENGGSEDCFVDKLLNQAYLQTGNDDEIIDLGDCLETAARKKYTPGGNIQVFETRTNSNIGMEGVKVQARRWFVVYYARPDFNGNYRMAHSFKRPCNYSIWFNESRFSIRQHLFNLTFWINGPKITGDWNYTLNNSYQQYVGHIFRAAYRYHNKDIGGLQRPFRWLGRRTIYVAKNGEKDPFNPIFINLIYIYRYSNGRELYSDEVYSATSHETAHTSHAIRMNTIIQYWQVSRQLQESWAVAVEWYLTNIEYANRGLNTYGNENYYPLPTPPDYPNSYAYQYWNPKFFKDQTFAFRYTPLFIDIVDNYNQSGHFYSGFNTAAVNDNVFGYTLPYIESDLLKHCYAISSLGQQLKNNKPVGVTDHDIDVLLSHF